MLKKYNDIWITLKLVSTVAGDAVALPVAPFTNMV